MLAALVTEYVSQVRQELAEEKLAELLSEGGLDRLHLAWGGATELGQPQHYRLHGGDFVIEFDNRQNQANHVHSVWRDAANDFAEDVLREHLLLYHVL